MSEEERLLAIGRLVEENREVRSRLATLLAEGTRIGRIVGAAGRYLAPSEDRVQGSLKDGGKTPDLAEFPSAEDLRKLITDVQETQRRKRELQQSLKEFGFEPKD